MVDAFRYGSPIFFGLEDPSRYAQIHANLSQRGAEPLRKIAYQVATSHFARRIVPDPEHPQMTPIDNAYLKLLFDSAYLLTQSKAPGILGLKEDYRNIPLIPLKYGPLHLDGADFSRITFLPVFDSESTFNHARFDGVNILFPKYPPFMGSFNGAHFNGANLHAPFSGSFNGAHFDGANLSGSSIHGSFNGACFDGADLSYTNFSGTDLSGTNLDNAASLVEANLYGIRGITQEQLNNYMARGAVWIAPKPPPPRNVETWHGSGN